VKAVMNLRVPQNAGLFLDADNVRLLAAQGHCSEELVVTKGRILRKILDSQDRK
jgi:hypothetical protein